MDQSLKQGELMSDEYKGFSEWLEKGLPLTIEEQETNLFINSIYLSQINPCLEFKNQQVIKHV